ncbi:MAG TPA: hypothetical protein VFP63_07725 [Dehalococcoidia bacterium]|nr:hypothetical protein [Dehalococcoidia bacterium]
MAWIYLVIGGATMAIQFGTITRKPFVSAACVGVVTAVVIAFVMINLSGDGSETGIDSVTRPNNPVESQTDGHGGGGAPSAALLKVFESLPLPSGVAVDQPPVSTGSDTMAVYWAQETPEQLLSFYTGRLPTLGWQPETPRGAEVSGPKDDGTRSTGLSLLFVKDDLRLIVGVSAGKDSSLGRAHFALTLQPR